MVEFAYVIRFWYLSCAFICAGSAILFVRGVVYAMVYPRKKETKEYKADGKKAILLSIPAWIMLVFLI